MKAACLQLQLLVQVVENVQRASIYCRRPHPELKKTTMKQVTAKIVLLDFMGHLTENQSAMIVKEEPRKNWNDALGAYQVRR